MNMKVDQTSNQVPYFIFIDGVAPSSDGKCTQGGIGIIVFDEVSNIIDERMITIKRKTDKYDIELLALIEALEYATDGDSIHSDSEFIVKGYNEWLDNWKAKGWRKSDKKPVAYRELWQQVDKLRATKYVEVIKVKAYIGGNEKAEALAFTAAHCDDALIVNTSAT
jgi:ribonuclease HI